MDKQSKTTMDIAIKFMGAMGVGEMETMMSLMHEDMVWQNAGDKRLYSISTLSIACGLLTP